MKTPACIGCGKCCTKYVVLQVGDNVPAKFRETIGTLTYMRRQDNFCAAFNQKSRSCSIYEQRPTACRVFLQGSPACLDIVAGLP